MPAKIRANIIMIAQTTLIFTDSWGWAKYFKPPILVAQAKSFKTCSNPIVIASKLDCSE